MEMRRPIARRTRLLGAGLLVAAAAPLAALDSATPVRAGSTTLVISEFRLRGAGGSTDEFIEIQNISVADITVADTGSGGGYAIVASDGIVRCVIPNGTVIPRFGHFLCVNSVGYSLNAYPGGHSTSSNGDDTFTIDIADNAGIALFDTDVPVDFTAMHRFDSVGSDTETDPLYVEGSGYPAITAIDSDQTFFRNLSNPQIDQFGATSATPGISEDTDDNAVDFVWVDVAGTSSAAGQRLGAPGPENLAAPVVNGGLTVDLLDSCVDENTAPNAVRVLTSNPSGNATFGTVEFRRTITNNTGGDVSRLRVRIADSRTYPATGGFADMRALTSPDDTDTVDRAPCGSGTSTATLHGTTLEEPATQTLGGGFNSSLGVGFVTLGAPLADGDSVDVRLLFGLEAEGYDSANLVVEAVSAGATTDPALTCLGMTDSGTIDSFCAGLPPVAVDDSYLVAHNTALTVLAGPGLLANDSDPDAQPISVVTANVSVPAHGVVNVNANGSFTYTPTTGYGGADSFTYTITDGLNTSSPATVSLTVAANQAPTATADTLTATEDTTLVLPAPGILFNDTDPESQPLTVKVSSLTAPTHGTATVNADGSVSYLPAANFHGTDSFTYKATDGTLDSATVTVTINVAAVNDPPVAHEDGSTALQNAPLVSPAPGPLANDTDADGDPLTAVLVTAPAHGVVTLNPDGSYVYTPNAGYVGSDSFTYAATDGSVASSPVTVTITVNGPTNGGGLPSTGADLTSMITVAGSSLLLGGMFLIGRRRRRA